MASFGAVILEWDAPAYNGHNHTEVWRAQVDDRAQASLVHEASGSRYTDVTGNTTLHYYWVRHVNSAGQVGGFNALAGTAGQGTAIISPGRPDAGKPGTVGAAVFGAQYRHGRVTGLCAGF